MDGTSKEIFYNLNAGLVVNRSNFHDLNSDLSAIRGKKIK